MIRPRRRATPAGLTLVLALLLAAAGGCGGDDAPADDGGQDTTTTTVASTETGPGEGGSDGGTTSGEEGTTTVPDETTTTAAPPFAGPDDLRALLVDPAAVGVGFALDPSVGTGAFTEDLCEDVVLDITWTEQASQALARGVGDDRAQVTQAVLRFADPAGAEAFVQAVLDGTQTCQPGAEVREVDSGDGTRWLEVVSGAFASSVAMVRSGLVVSAFNALYPSADGDPITPALLVAAGQLLGG